MRLLFVLIIVLAFSNVSQSQELKVVGEVNYTLEDTGIYRVLGVNENYLVWFDFQMGTLFMYNIEKNEMSEKEFSQGRGPSEYMQPTSMYVDEEDVVYLSDFPNSKLIVWNIKEERFQDDIRLNVPPFRIARNENSLYIFNLTNPVQPINLLELDTRKETPIDLEGGFFENSKPYEVLFNRDGSFMYVSNQVIHLSKHKSALFIFSVGADKDILKVNTIELAKKQEIGIKETKLADGSVQQNLDVTKLLQSQSFAKHPTKEANLLIVFRDNRSKPVYYSKSIYTYSLNNEKIESEKSSKFDFSIDQIVANNSQVFALSEEKGKIFILE